MCSRARWIPLAIVLCSLPVIAAPSFAPLTPDGSRRLVVVTIDASSGRLLPARLRIERMRSRAAPVYVVSSGTARPPAFDAPVRIVATCGPSYRPRVVEVGDAPHVVLPLERVLDERGYVPVDLHVHTTASPDGTVGAGDRSDALAAEGIRFAIATDHNVVTALPERPSLATAPGVEVTTWAPEVGHFNVFPITRAPRYQQRAPDELFHELHADGRAVVIANHPRLDDHIAYFGLAGLDARGRVRAGFSLDFDALEVWNGYDLARRERVERVFLEWLALVARGRRITATGSSDSHRATGQWVGYPRTMVRLSPGDALDGDGVAYAIRAGRTFVTSGPMLFVDVEGAGPGDQVRVGRDDGVDVTVRVEAPASMRMDTVELFVGTRRVVELDVPRSRGVTRFVARVRVPVGDAGCLVARTSGHGDLEPLVDRRGAFPMAFTSPVWLTR